jgi:hypothetical protein
MPKEGSRYRICKAGTLGLGQESGRRQKTNVLKSPKRRLGIQKTRGNQSIKESIQEVV